MRMCTNHFRSNNNDKKRSYRTNYAQYIPASVGGPKQHH